jgi:hypothetical protein
LSVSQERYPDHEVIHIWKLEHLYEVLLNHQVLNEMMTPEFRTLSKADFVQEVRAAKAHGHAIDRAVRASSAPVNLGITSSDFSTQNHLVADTAH